MLPGSVGWRLPDGRQWAALWKFDGLPNPGCVVWSPPATCALDIPFGRSECLVCLATRRSRLPPFSLLALSPYSPSMLTQVRSFWLCLSWPGSALVTDRCQRETRIADATCSTREQMSGDRCKSKAPPGTNSRMPDRSMSNLLSNVNRPRKQKRLRDRCHVCFTGGAGED